MHIGELIIFGCLLFWELSAADYSEFNLCAHFDMFSIGFRLKENQKSLTDSWRVF